MNCRKCGNPLMPGAKFCLKCGLPVDDITASKPVAPTHKGMPKPGAPAPTIPRPGMPKPGIPVGGRPASSDSKGLFFGNHDQPAPVVTPETERAADHRSMELVKGIDVVQGRAIWNIHPGQIARRIKESELAEVEKLKGIIVQEGCTAVIYANGEKVAELSAGAYQFHKTVDEEIAAINAAVEAAQRQMDKAERQRLAQRRQTNPSFMDLGIVGELGRAARWVGRLIFGRKKQDPTIQQRQIDYARLLSRFTQPPVMAVYIVSDRHIPLTFGARTDAEGNMVFAPYSIPVGIRDVEIGVSLEVRVSDLHQLIVNYLADRTSLTTTEIYNTLSPAIANLLRSSLRNMQYVSEGLPADLIEKLKEEIIHTVDQHLHGLRCTAVHSITDSNTDFERFRNVERQLYNTEREIDYMQRTGEFRNRLETEANSQQIRSARNAEELRHAMQNINTDRLLHDDEMEEFVEMLESQRRIRQATTAEEERSALDELRKSRLVKQDDIEALEDALLHKRIPRQEITQLMRIQSQWKVDEAALKAEWALNDQRTDHDWEREDLERRRNWGIEDESRERQWIIEQREYDRSVGRRRSEDEYDFQRMMRTRRIETEDRREERAARREDEDREFQRLRVNREDEDRIEGNRHQRDIDKLQAMARMQAELDAQRFRHEENVATISSNERINRDNLFSGMTPEQIRAAQLSHLSDEAQVSMANAYGSEKELANLRASASEKEAMMQQMLRMQQDSSAVQMNVMMQMAGMIKETATGVSGSFQSMQQRQMETLEAQRAHEQARNARLQDTAIDSISRVSTAAAGNINAFNGGIRGYSSSESVPKQTVTSSKGDEVEFECYNCGHTIRLAYGAGACPDCGAPFRW